jgi:glycerophosphoryl diester phosphodiesterase
MSVYTFAHRGGRAHGRDNEIATFVEALRRGATGLETDAWVTSDDQVVLDHDGVHRTAARRRSPISQVRRSELPAHVPTLDDLYAACGTDFELAIDIKNSTTADAVLRIAEAHNAADRLWLFAHTGVVFDHLGAAHACKTLHARDLLGPGRLHQLQAARSAGIKAINARWLWWRESVVEQVHSLGLLAFGYDAQQSSSIQRCIDLGLDGMFSDHVDRMHAALERG